MKKIFLVCVVVVLALAVLPADAESLVTKWEAEAAGGAVLSDPIPVMPTPDMGAKPHYPARTATLCPGCGMQPTAKPTRCPSCGYQP